MSPKQWYQWKYADRYTKNAARAFFAIDLIVFIFIHSAILDFLLFPESRHGRFLITLSLGVLLSSYHEQWFSGNYFQGKIDGWKEGMIEGSEAIGKGMTELLEKDFIIIPKPHVKMKKGHES